jgi:DNA (cytosine-5)-methyltransferase 1
MRELSLFSGAGGGLLGTYLLGWKHIGYVEFNDYCQRVIRQRIIDGILPNAPIFGDVRTFISDGYAASYQGMVDVITGGFPCQPFSVAGKRAGADDPRNMWPATRDCVRIVRPRHCFFENVPGLLNSGYFGTIVNDLAQSGYCVRWRILSAAELGAPHKRDRLWIVADASSTRAGLESWRQGGSGRQERQPANAPESTMVRQEHGANCTEGDNSGCADATYTNGQRGQRCGAKAIYRKSALPWGENIRSLADMRNRSDIPEPLFYGVANGLADRVGPLGAIGNGQVPAVARAAWELLTGGAA